MRRRAAPPKMESPESFQERLDPLLPSAFGFALSLGIGEGDAAELVEEAALEAFQRSAGPLAGDDLRVSFFRILVRRWRGDPVRGAGRTLVPEIENFSPLYLFERMADLGLLDRAQDPARELARRLDLGQIREALDALPGEYRVLTAVFLAEDFSFSQVAEVADDSLASVRSHLHRGRCMFEKSLWSVATRAGIVAELERARQLR